MDEVRRKWRKVVFTKEFSIVDPIVAVALASVHLEAIANYAAVAEILGMIHGLGSKGIDPTNCFFSKLTISHYKKIGDPTKLFRKGKWIGTHNGIMFYFARGKRGFRGSSTFQNLGKSVFRDDYLDIDGKTGAVILNHNKATGTHWQVNDAGNNRFTLQNLGDSPYLGYYLDIDGRRGTLMLNNRKASGVFWTLKDHGDGKWSLKKISSQSN